MRTLIGRPAHRIDAEAARLRHLPRAITLLLGVLDELDERLPEFLSSGTQSSSPRETASSSSSMRAVKLVVDVAMKVLREEAIHDLGRCRSA